MTADEIVALFTRSYGSYLFARWQRPIVPVVFGVEDASLPVIKGAFEAVVTLAGHRMSETDPDLGANLMLFFVRGWSELLDVPGLDRLVPELAQLVLRLDAAGANQYRIFRFEAEGAIRACFVFLLMDQALTDMPAETLALAQAVQTVLLWSDRAFDGSSPLVRLKEHVMLRPDIGALIRAAYDPVLPAVANDQSHALRLYARVGRPD